jgi:nicotinate-nucleotide adenylyltransferase
MSKHIGIFGGSFDPPHFGHLALMSAAREQLGLDQLRVIPTGHAWQKLRTLTPARHRLVMVELAIAGMAPWAVVDALETERKGPSYMIDTIEALRKETGDAKLTLILGEDQFANLRTWHRWEDLAMLVRFAVAGRPGSERSTGSPANDPRVHHVRLAMEPMDLSSTQLRKMAAAGEPLNGLVPPTVAQYIALNHLYKEQKH